MSRTTTHVASWGIEDGAVSSVTGVVTGVDLTTEEIAADEPNEIGAVIGHVIYDARRTGRITVNCTAANAKTSLGKILASNGSTLTLGTLSALGETFHISNVELIESNQDFTKVVFSVITWLHSGAAVLAT